MTDNIHVYSMPKFFKNNTKQYQKHKFWGQHQNLLGVKKGRTASDIEKIFPYLAGLLTNNEYSDRLSSHSLLF